MMVYRLNVELEGFDVIGYVVDRMIGFTVDDLLYYFSEGWDIGCFAGELVVIRFESDDEVGLDFDVVGVRCFSGR